MDGNFCPICNEVVENCQCSDKDLQDYRDLQEFNFNEQRIAGALALAQQLHDGQMRKSNPSMSVLKGHLIPVSELVREYGGSTEVIMAALLHDSIEDCDQSVKQEIIETCGADVLALVEECTEPGTGAGYTRKAPWRERKEGYLENLGKSSPEGLLISLADKTQQAEELSASVAVKGDTTFDIFKQGKEGTVWFFSELSRVYHSRELNNTPIVGLLARFDAALAELLKEK